MINPDNSLHQDTFGQEDPFDFIRPEAFEALGIDPSDIPPGTFAAHKHPSQLSSRFGGNAYGVGLFEVYDRLDPRDMELLQAVNHEEPDHIRRYYTEINRIYENLGLLIRFSSKGTPFYLIPEHLLSSSISNIKNKVDEISKIVHFHRKKFLKESHHIGVLTNMDDLVVKNLSIRFKEHRFFIIDSLEKLRSINETLDLVILTRDIYEIILMERFTPLSREIISRKQLDKYAYYILGNIFKVLKEDGELFIIANHYPLKTNQMAMILFKTAQEKRNFTLFSHIFKTRKKYQIKGKSLQVNTFDFQKYLSGLYVEQEVIDSLLGERDLEEMTLKEINSLSYLNFPLDNEIGYDQQKIWPELLSVYFNPIFFKPMIPDTLKSEWGKRFSTSDYSPRYKLIFLGQKKPRAVTKVDLWEDITDSRLAGCPLALVADYRDSFEYLNRTLNVLVKIKRGNYGSLPEIYMERLKHPLENKKRRYSGLNDVIRLMSKTNRLEMVKTYLNPDMIEGTETRVLDNLELLSFFGFDYGELREIFLIILGHTAMGRIISGKTNEKALKPVSDLGRSYEPAQALNLLRYCRLMSMAEIVVSQKADLNQGQLTELFDLFESVVRVVINREMDWDRLLDEKISSMGGIHNKIIRKILKLINHFQFLDNWSELRDKGEMEKEALADYDAGKLKRIENVIKLIDIIEKFEDMFLKDDPLQLPIFYRKFFNMEFHGTGHIFEKMDSRLVFILLWLTVNVARGEIINFNPFLADVAPADFDSRVKKVEEETGAINANYLDLETTRQFSEQLYENKTAFIIGTGFQLKVDDEIQALDIQYIDMDDNIEKLDILTKKYINIKISEIPEGDLEELERLFANLEGFYQSHLRLISQGGEGLKFPEREKKWFKKAGELRDYLRSNFIKVIFQPENIYADINLLYRHARSLLTFILPEFMALRDIRPVGHTYLKSSLIDYILTSIKKMQALIRRDRENFQDIRLLHQLAQREFGPMAAGIVGVSDSQIEKLENIVEKLRHKSGLFDALIKSLIFQDLGRIPGLREKYKDEINPVDQARAGALFLEKEEISQRYDTGKEAHNYLITLVKYHDLFHHIIRGEFSINAIEEVINFRDIDLFDAFFLNSFIMLSAIREELILEDVAERLFQTRTLCHRIIENSTTLEDYLREVYAGRGHLFYALEEYRREGLPEGMTPAVYLESWRGRETGEKDYIRAGKMIYAMERVFRLRGIKYVEFSDLVKIMIKIPLKFVYQKRNYYGIGYATFEKELFEAFRIYNGLQNLPEEIRHFILENMTEDKFRIFGFENVSIYLNYENLIKLLLIALLGAERFKKNNGPICLNFLDMAEKIEKRYEGVNDTLNKVSVDKIWKEKNALTSFFRAKTGLLLRKNKGQRALSIDFKCLVNISQKLTYITSINNVEQLKNYFHYSLQTLRKTPFHTDDFELQLEKAYDKRLKEITDLMLDQAKKQMEIQKDFLEIHNLLTDLMGRSLEIGFTEEQKNKLNDLYELRKDSLKREKLNEINKFLKTISDTNELHDYWDGIKWYLLNNRPFIGKEFENLIAKRFDEVRRKLQGN